MAIHYPVAPEDDGGIEMCTGRVTIDDVSSTGGDLGHVDSPGAPFSGGSLWQLLQAPLGAAFMLTVLPAWVIATATGKASAFGV